MTPATIQFLYCLCVVAVVCNLLAIVVIWSSKLLRSTTDIFIVNLAVGGVLMCGLAMPLKLMNAAAREFYGGDVVCKLVMFIPICTITSTIFTMVLISFDRYNAIVRWSYWKTKRVVKIIAVVWILSIVTSSPQLYEYSVYHVAGSNETKSVCGAYEIVEGFEMYYSIAVLVVCYLAPLIVMSGCYSRLIIYVWRRSISPTTTEHTVRGRQVSTVKLKVLKMAVTVTSVFAILWLPYFVMFTIEEISGSSDIADVTWLHAFKTILATLSSVSNPVIYALLNTKFRREARALITSKSMT